MLTGFAVDHQRVVDATRAVRTRLRPDFPWPYNNCGTVHLRLEEFELAVADYGAALAADPALAEAYADRAAALCRLGRPGDALRYAVASDSSANARVVVPASAVDHQR